MEWQEEEAEEFGGGRRVSDVGGSRRHMSSHSLGRKGSEKLAEEDEEVHTPWWRRCFPSKAAAAPPADAEVAQVLECCYLDRILHLPATCRSGEVGLGWVLWGWG